MIVDWLFEARATLENPAVSLQDPEAMEELFGGGARSDAGETVTHAKVLGYAPVRQAVSMISGDCAKLPLEVFKRLPDDNREVDHRHPTYKRINLYGKANREISAWKLWRRYFAHALLWENGYIWIDRDLDGRPRELINLLPDRTAPVRVDGKLWIVTEVSTPSGGRRLKVLKTDDVLHLEGLCIDGVKGSDLVEDFRHNFGLALAARKFTSKFFANGAHAGGILQVPPGTKKEVKTKIQKGIQEKHTTSDKAFRTMVLRDGFKWHTTMVDPQKAKLTEIDEQEVRHVARMYNLNPSRLGIKDSQSYNSEEHAERDYHNGTLSHWLMGNRSECNIKLLSQEERENRTHFIDYNINALLWADAKTRAEIADAGIQSGRFNPNETRRWENLNGYDGGDKFLRPLNMAPVDEEPEDQEEQDERTKTIREAHVQLLAGALTRVARRIGGQARRAAKRQDLAHRSWLAELVLEHGPTCQQMIACEVQACRAVLDLEITDEVAMSAIRALQDLLGLQEPSTWEPLIARFEETIGRDLAEHIISGETP